MDYPKITHTMTMGRRLGFFMRTMHTFLDCCLDQDLISEWIVNDDRSSPEDLAYIKKQFPFLKIVSAKNPGQAAALNNLFDHVNTEWIYHNEDDWYYSKKGHFIRECLEIAHDHAQVRNVVLRQWDAPFIKSGDLEYKMHIFDTHMGRTENDRIQAMRADRRWFGYSLNPGLQHIPTIRWMGKYDESAMSRKFDRALARKYWQGGYRRANLSTRYCFHIGWDAPVNFPGGNERV